MQNLSRRDALRATAAGALLASQAQAQSPAKPGLTVRMNEPKNLESAFGDLDSYLTPIDQFFVRSHFAVPEINPNTWTLSVEGAVENPFKIGLDGLRAMPTTTMPLTLECAGNGRVFLTPAARGLQWQFGAVGNAKWTGVPLSAILERAKVKATAVEVILVGGDKGTLGGDHPTPGPIAFDRSIPIEKAKKPEVLLAYKQNGVDLTPSHGFPLRAVVGGWFGMASVKWLSRIIVTEKPYNGFWQTIDYATYERRDGGLATLTPITAMQPKAQIARPLIGEIVPAGKAYTVRGSAWAGEAEVAMVEVSADGGKTWAEAKLGGQKDPFCWRQWEYAWTAPATAGPVKLLCRCVDANGKGQSETRDADRRTYVINHLVPVEVTVQ
jgi:DMSO/TMAO reductase YedYZ molybdopterin-dependent catalytic subunit